MGSRYLLVLGLVICAIAVCDDSDHECRWTAFKAKFGKAYATADDEAYRFSVYKESCAKLAQIQAEQTLATFAEYEDMDLTVDEQHRKLGLNPNMESAFPETTFVPEISSRKRATMPESWLAPYMTVARNQGGCGACWAFSAEAVMEASHKKVTNTTEYFSVQQNIDCAPGAPDRCNGYGPIPVLRWYSSIGSDKAQGIVRNSDYAWLGDTQTGAKNCGVDYSKSVGKAQASWTIPWDESEGGAIQQHLFYNGPMALGIDASTLNGYQTGIIQATSTCAGGRNHAVTLSGWGVSGGTKYWTIKNSWSNTWGESLTGTRTGDLGYFRIVRGVKACNLDGGTGVTMIGDTFNSGGLCGTRQCGVVDLNTPSNVDGDHPRFFSCGGCDSGETCTTAGQCVSVSTLFSKMYTTSGVFTVSSAGSSKQLAEQDISPGSGDITSGLRPATSCDSWCRNVRGCKASVYVASTGRCYLKSVSTPTISSAGHTSYVVPSTSLDLSAAATTKEAYYRWGTGAYVNKNSTNVTFTATASGTGFVGVGLTSKKDSNTGVVWRIAVPTGSVELCIITSTTAKKCQNFGTATVAVGTAFTVTAQFLRNEPNVALRLFINGNNVLGSTKFVQLASTVLSDAGDAILMSQGAKNTFTGVQATTKTRLIATGGVCVPDSSITSMIEWGGIRQEDWDVFRGTGCTGGGYHSGFDMVFNDADKLPSWGNDGWYPFHYFSNAAAQRLIQFRDGGSMKSWVGGEWTLKTAEFPAYGTAVQFTATATEPLEQDYHVSSSTPAPQSSIVVPPADSSSSKAPVVSSTPVVQSSSKAPVIESSSATPKSSASPKHSSVAASSSATPKSSHVAPVSSQHDVSSVVAKSSGKPISAGSTTAVHVAVAATALVAILL